MASRRQPPPIQSEPTTGRAKRTADSSTIEGPARPGSKRLRTEIKENAAPARRSDRSTNGQGGALSQMQASSEAIQRTNCVKEKKSRAQSIPGSVTASLMAPAPKKHGRHKVDQVVPVLKFGFQHENSGNGPQLQERAIVTPSLPQAHIISESTGRPATKALPPASATRVARARTSNMLMQGRPQQPSQPSLHPASSSTAPLRQRQIGALQRSYHPAPFDEGSTQVTGSTDPESSEGNGNNSELENEPDEVNSSNDEGLEQVPLGTCHGSPSNYQDRSPRSLHNDADETGVQGFYDADDVHGISEGGDDKYQGSNAEDAYCIGQSQDPLLQPGFDRSPSEDERRAEAQLYQRGDSEENALTTSPKKTATQKFVTRDTENHDDSYGVLRCLQDRNRVPLPLDSQQLEKFHSHHRNVAEMDEDSDIERHSQRPYSGHSDNPKNLGFYPPQWRDILENAKRRWRLWMVLMCDFQNSEKENYHKAMECVVEALATHQRNGGRVEKGIWPKYQCDMQGYVFADRSTFRGVIKNKSTEVVHQLYDFYPTEYLNNQQEEIDHIASAIKKLVYRGRFLSGGLDEHGRTDNLTHPAVMELSIFIYGLVLNVLPADFEDIIPCRIVALASAAIKCCLDAWRSGWLDRNDFTTEKYGPAYDGTLILIEHLKRHGYHWNKFVTARRSWATAAKFECRPADGLETTDMEIHLD